MKKCSFLWEKNGKNYHLWAEHERRYQYREWIPIPMVHIGTKEKWYRYLKTFLVHKGSGTGTHW